MPKLKNLLAFAIAVLAMAAVPSADAGGYKVLFGFNGVDGSNPKAGLLRDSSGNLFGTTAAGGAHDVGTVFRLAPSGTETVLYTFTGGNDGGSPLGGLAADKAGNFYGATYVGGGAQAGVVYEITAAGTFNALYSFTAGSDGGFPMCTFVMDSKGNLYGTTEGGGTKNNGVVFEMTAAGKEKVLYAFSGKKDGAHPEAGVIRDQAGNLYGTTFAGGAHAVGVVFELAADGTETALHSFAGSDGANPESALIEDGAGNLYGTTLDGGPGGSGTVYKLAADGSFSVLYSFTGAQDGGAPQAGLVMDNKGNLYGTTSAGGKNGNGAVFEIAADGAEKVLYAFSGKKSGGSPTAGLIVAKADGKAPLSGTASSGGPGGNGIVFDLKPE